ncbi:MAG: RidA family protein [Acidobacteriota bacterium]
MRRRLFPRAFDHHPTTPLRHVTLALRTLTRLALVLVALAPGFTGAQEAEGEAGSTARRIVAPPGTGLGLPFSPAIAAGDFLYLSGALGNQPGTTQMAEDLGAQTRQTLDNLQRVLTADGLTEGRVVFSETFVADSRWHGAVADNERRRPGAPTVDVARAAVTADLALPGAKLEIAKIAVREGVEIRAVHPDGWRRIPGTSSGVEAGDTLFLSTQLGADPATGEIVDGGIAPQTRRAMDNVGQVLKAAGLDYGDLARCRVYLADSRDYGAMNDAYGSFLGEEPPARATVRASLDHPDALIGIQCVAVRDPNRKVIRAPGTKPSGRPFSPAILAGGRLFLSGMVGRGADGYPDGVGPQTQVVLDRLEATLAAAGLGFHDVVSAAVFLSDVRYYGDMNAVYAKGVGSPAPARATVGSLLMTPKALVEIEMTAVVPTP